MKSGASEEYELNLPRLLKEIWVLADEIYWLRPTVDDRVLHSLSASHLHKQNVEQVVGEACEAISATPSIVEKVFRSYELEGGKLDLGRDDFNELVLLFETLLKWRRDLDEKK